MRLQSILLFPFLVSLIAFSSLAEASKRGGKHKKRRKGKNKNKEATSSTTLLDTPTGPGREIPVQQTLESQPKQERVREHKINVEEALPSSFASVGKCNDVVALPAASEKCVIASVDESGDEFRKAVDAEDFEWFSQNYSRWSTRDDLISYATAKGVDFLNKFVARTGLLGTILASLFNMGSCGGIIQEVLKEHRYSVNYNVLEHLTDLRLDLLDPPEKFLKVLDRAERPGTEEHAVVKGISNLYLKRRYDLVVPLIEALGKRTFKTVGLRDIAIQGHFVMQLCMTFKV